MVGEINGWIFHFSCYRNQLKRLECRQLVLVSQVILKSPSNFNSYLCLSSTRRYSSQHINKFQFSCSYMKLLFHHVIQNKF